MAERGLVASREKAQAVILAGLVSVGGRRAAKAAESVATDQQIDLERSDAFVSRAGQKLEHALARFEMDIRGLVCLDAGASTGGFTDCLLRRGADRVYAVDVGLGQLDWKLQIDPRVIVRDRTNVRLLTQLPEPVDLAVVDVSFISLKLVLPALSRLVVEGGPIVALIKPQFEAGRGVVPRGGVVRDERVHQRVLAEIWTWCVDEGLDPRGLTASPVRGPAGNVEFLIWVRNGSDPSSEPLDQSTAIRNALAEAPTRGA